MSSTPAQVHKYIYQSICRADSCEGKCSKKGGFNQIADAVMKAVCRAVTIVLGMAE